MAGTLIRVLCPAEDLACKSVRYLLREIVASAVLTPIINASRLRARAGKLSPTYIYIRERERVEPLDFLLRVREDV